MLGFFAGMTPGGRRLQAVAWLCRAVSPLTTQLSPPPPVLWKDVTALADAHLLLPELHAAIERHGLQTAVPTGLGDMIAEIDHLNAARNALLRLQMTEISRSVRRRGDAGLVEGSGGIA
jgi:hypothetical protein